MTQKSGYAQQRLDILLDERPPPLPLLTKHAMDGDVFGFLTVTTASSWRISCLVSQGLVGTNKEPLSLLLMIAFDHLCLQYNNYIELLSLN